MRPLQLRGPMGIGSDGRFEFVFGEPNGQPRFAHAAVSDEEDLRVGVSGANWRSGSIFETRDIPNLNSAIVKSRHGVAPIG